MKSGEVARAVVLILDGKGKPVTLRVRKLPGSTVTEVTTYEPTGRFAYSYVVVGTYTLEITLDELRADLRIAEKELNTRPPRVLVDWTAQAA